MFYFPLKNKLKSLLRLPAYQRLLNHEFERPRNPGMMTDVYDSPAWTECMGPASIPAKRIGLLFCIDGIPAFSQKDALSLKPAEFMNLSLPPSVRCRSENMLFFMLLPSTLKTAQQMKYYSFAATFELNSIFNDGIDGVSVRCFGTSMDTPGRAELLGMQSSAAYQSCCVCTHSWSEGLVKKCIYDGYRRFLSETSRARQREFRFRGITYEFRKVEHLVAPRLRNNQFVREAVAVANETGEPFLGHKCMSMLTAWPGFQWRRMNIPDLMHDSKLFVEMLLKVIVDYAKDGWYKQWKRDRKHRAECKAHGKSGLCVCVFGHEPTTVHCICRDFFDRLGRNSRSVSLETHQATTHVARSTDQEHCLAALRRKVMLSWIFLLDQDQPAWQNRPQNPVTDVHFTDPTS